VERVDRRARIGELDQARTPENCSNVELDDLDRVVRRTPVRAFDQNSSLIAVSCSGTQDGEW